jgi:hypothetical protein
MALPPTLKEFRDQLRTMGTSKRTYYQDKLLEELDKLDGAVIKKVIDEASFASATRMTSPGGDGCPCCGR